MLTILIIIVVCVLLFGGLGYSRQADWGYAGYSPLLLILLLVVVLYVLGVIR